MLNTEKRNPKTLHIDQMKTIEMMQVISEENFNAVKAVAAQITVIAKAVDEIAAALEHGGRLFYIGSGTSGRLAVADAAECPPTFGVPQDLVTGIIAGGYNSLLHASETAEDSAENGKKDILACHIKKEDILVGISASGGASYVLGAMEQAKLLGCTTIALTCNENSPIDQAGDIRICTDTGPEVITGSTRMKAGTAQKLVLNMLSTGVMVKLGKVYGNLMVDVKASNEKLRERCVRIVRQATGAEDAAARAALIETNYACKPAIVMLLLGVDKTRAETLLTRANGRVAAALEG